MVIGGREELADVEVPPGVDVSVDIEVRAGMEVADTEIGGIEMLMFVGTGVSIGEVVDGMINVGTELFADAEIDGMEVSVGATEVPVSVKVVAGAERPIDSEAEMAVSVAEILAILFMPASAETCPEASTRARRGDLKLVNIVSAVAKVGKCLRKFLYL